MTFDGPFQGVPKLPEPEQSPYAKVENLIEYTRIFTSLIPPYVPRERKSDNPYKISQLMNGLIEQDLYISCEFAEQILEISTARAWLKALHPVLVHNIMYVQAFNGLDPSTQDIQHHQWLESLKHNRSIVMHASLKECLQKVDRFRNYVHHWNSLDTSSLEALKLMNQLREISTSPGKFIPEERSWATGQIRDSMLQDLPVTMQGIELGAYVADWFVKRLDQNTAGVTMTFGNQPNIVFVGNTWAAYPASVQQAMARSVRNSPPRANKPNAQQVTKHTIAGPRGCTSQQTVVIDSANWFGPCTGKVSVQSRVDIPKAVESPRGKFKSIPGHDSVNPWKNKGKRGRFK